VPGPAIGCPGPRDPFGARAVPHPLYRRTPPHERPGRRLRIPSSSPHCQRSGRTRLVPAAGEAL